MTNTRRAEAIWVEARSRWQINVQRDGKRKTFTSPVPGRKGKHEAEAKADEWLDAGQPDEMRFDAAWPVFLEHIRKTTGTANYKDHECIGRVWLLPVLGTKRLSKLKLADVQDIVDDAAAQGKSARTCKNIKSKFFAFALFAADQHWDMDSINPKKVKISKKAPKAVRTIVQPDQLQVLFRVGTELCYGVERPCFYIYAFRLFVLTGMRRGELCGLTWDDYKDGVLIVQRSINRFREVTDGKNENAQRYIPLTSHSIALLDAQREMLRERGITSKWIFPDTHGRRLVPNNLYKSWQKYSAQRGISSSLHELRHTFVSIMENDVPDPLLKRVVGHSESMDTHGVYGHAMDGDLRRALGLMEEVFASLLGN